MAWPKGRSRKPKEDAVGEENTPDSVDPSLYDQERREGDAPDAIEAERAPRASRKVASKKKGRAINPNGIEKMLMGIHFTLATMTKNPELILQDAEAKMISESAASVMRHYDVPEVPEKMMDWGNLLVSLYLVYTPRICAIARRKADEAKKKK